MGRKFYFKNNVFGFASLQRATATWLEGAVAACQHIILTASLSDNVNYCY